MKLSHRNAVGRGYSRGVTRRSNISATIAFAILAPLVAEYVFNAILFGAAVPVSLFVGAMGFTSIVVVCRMRVLAGILAAAIYFPLILYAAFMLGIWAGYYDFP